MATEVDITVIGGGLGGLSLSILMARQGFSVALLEKESFPRHRVCGEYISNESRAFLEHLAPSLSEMDLPRISRLAISSPKGKLLRAPLELGGFGISRYTLDHLLAEIAWNSGVLLEEKSRVDKVLPQGEKFLVQSRKGDFLTRVVVGAFGKRSNLDRSLERPFMARKGKSAPNYLGVKYHVRNPEFPSDLIELSNFPGGYCGMSQVENGLCCFCYLTTAQSLQDHHNSIPELEKTLLRSNPHLAHRMEQSTFLWENPVTISQVNFQVKSPLEGHILMVGDAAGTIAPLAGNGMSMSLHSAWMLSGNLTAFLRNEIDRSELERRYQKDWKGMFRGRINRGRNLQTLFGKPFLSEVAIGTLNWLPWLLPGIIRSTHGKPFFTPE